MTRYVPAAGLNARVAQAIVRPRIDRLAADVAANIRRAAPAAKEWLTSEDDRVRHSHRDTNGQNIPANLRYQLPKYHNDQRQPGVDLGREPRDPNLPFAQTVACRCESVEIPGAIARSVSTHQTVISGPKVSAKVTVDYNRVAESENPDTGDSGGGWVRGAVQETAVRNRARR